MKIAICLYGKFTGINNRGDIQGFEIPFEYLKKNIINDNTDIFFMAGTIMNPKVKNLLN